MSPKALFRDRPLLVAAAAMLFLLGHQVLPHAQYLLAPSEKTACPDTNCPPPPRRGFTLADYPAMLVDSIAMLEGGFVTTLDTADDQERLRMADRR